MWGEYSEKIKSLENNPEGYTSIYDIVNNGYWTLDLWMDICNLVYVDSNNNDKFDYQDQTGLFSYNETINNLTPDMLAAGSHVTYSRLDEEGMPVADVNSQKNRSFAEKLYQLMVESKVVCSPMIQSDSEEGDNYNVMEIFAMGNALMTTSELKAAEIYLADMTDDFYVMPLPMYDRTQYKADAPSKGYSTQLHDSLTQFAICKDIGAERVPMVTATMELMAYYSKKLVTPAYYDKALKDRYTRNPQDAAIIDMIREGLYIDFAAAWSNRLSNLTWYFRENYSDKNYAGGLKKLGGTVSLNMKMLKEDLEEAYWVE